MKLHDLTQSKLLRRSLAWAVGGGVAAGLAIAFVLSTLFPTAGLTVLVITALVVGILLAIPIVGIGLLLYETRENGRRTQMLVNVRQLLGDVPMPVGGWAMEADLGNLIVQTIQDRRPLVIVECGSGSSTVLASAVLRLRGAGRIVSLEHDAAFAERTREHLRERGLDDIAEVITAPLVTRTVEGEERSWYDVDIDSEIPSYIDLLIVDGPPGRGSKLARYPAVPLLMPLFSAGCVVLLDDGNRRDERQIAAAWARMMGVAPRRTSEGKGAWVLDQAAKA